MPLAQQVFSLLGLTSNLLTLNQYCLPRDSCYPSHSAFAELDRSLDGRLYRPSIPSFECVRPECFSQDWRADHSNLAMFSNFESGFGLPGSNATSLEDVGPGRTPEYVAEVHSARDIAKVVKFSKRNNLRLRIKSTGHDYLGRSSDAGSLTIWTHKLKKTSYKPRFLPAGAPRSQVPKPALLAQSGVQVIDLYQAADKAGVVVTGGASKSVGAAGGFALGGGHGPLAPLHGLAVDNILEMTVVLSDGSIVQTSPYRHPDLFTALRGGGSAFGVVVEVAFLAHPPPSEGFVGVFGEFKLADDAPDPDAAWKELLKQWTAIQPRLSDIGFAGYSYLRKTATTPFAYILPSHSTATRYLAEHAFESFIDFVNQNAQLEITVKFVEQPSWYPLWSGDFTEALQGLDVVGINLLLGSRLIPRAVVDDNSDALADYLATLTSPAIVHLVAGGAVSKESLFPTTVNPAWRKSLLHIDLPISWPSNATLDEIRGLQTYLTEKTLALGAIAQFDNGVQASYSSESDFNEEHWQTVWYGDENYQTLLAAKQSYDPHGVFTGRRVVGSELVGY
ncbi:hypothetical protein RQP46_006725 [Phenoliferia psychrophenolica]